MRLDAAAILDRRRELAASVLASAVTSRSTFSTMERPVRDVGRKLFKALFAGPVYGRYTASLQEASRRGEPLRVVLRLRAPELAGIPWETLFDPEGGEYLCQREPLVRYVDVAQPSAPLTATGPLRILGMVAAPRDLPALDTAEERRRLDDALGELVDQGQVEMVWVESGTWGALQQKLMAGPWHALHLVGHGGTDVAGGVLALEDEHTGNTARVSAGRFARLLHACRPVPRLVVLNCCSSGESAADDLLSSTAAALVHSGITATVAMQFAVTDPAALAFSRGFYQALAHNIAVDEAVRLGRIAIDGTSEQTLEWVTPVVYLRTDDTRLFELTSTGTPPQSAQGSQAARLSQSAQVREEAISHEAAAYGLYVQAMAAARKERYDEAEALLDSLITLDPSYRDATDLRARMRRQQRLEAEYAAARAAEDEGDWQSARRGYRSVIDLDRDHRDALRRHDAAARHVSVASLQDELRVHAGEQDWEAVLAVSSELGKLDPAASDPDGLASQARGMLGLSQPTRSVSPSEAPVDQPTQPLPQQSPPQQPQPQQSQPQQPLPPPVIPPVIQPVEPPAPPDSGLVDEDEQEGGGWKRALKLVLLIGIPIAVVAVLAAVYLGREDPTPPDPGQVTCWNGSSAADAGSCSTPEGFEGLSTVFPSMDETCESVQPSVGEKAELFECVYDNYTIRYSRWDDGYDRYAYMDANIKGAQTDDWTLDGVVVGRAWMGYDERKAEDRRYRWIGAYESAPFDVTVKGVDEAGLEEGYLHVRAKQPEQIGLP
ncbi:MAG: CHAT domain-containing protein, partial [Marmoricola sp.]